MTTALIPRIDLGTNRKHLDPRAGFTCFGEFASAIIRASLPGSASVDPRLQDIAAATPTTFGNESSAPDGGFATPVAFQEAIFTHSDAEIDLLRFCDTIPIEANSMALPVDEGTPWGTSGLRVYWQAEATGLPQQKPLIGESLLRMHKLIAFTPISEDLVADASALNAYLPRRIGDSVRWNLNEAILFGDGAGQPLGCLTSPGATNFAGVVVAKESGQATGTLQVANLAKMYTRLPAGAHQRAVWLMQPDTLALGLMLGGLAFPMTNPLPQFPGSCGTLIGRPVFASQHCAALSLQGDVMLVDLSYYTAIVKSPPLSTAMSVHLYFDAYADAFRTTLRVDGAPKIKAPLASAKGGSTLSPFVVLGAR